MTISTAERYQKQKELINKYLIERRKDEEREIEAAAKAIEAQIEKDLPRLIEKSFKS